MESSVFKKCVKHFSFLFCIFIFPIWNYFKPRFCELHHLLLLFPKISQYKKNVLTLIFKAACRRFDEFSKSLKIWRVWWSIMVVSLMGVREKSLDMSPRDFIEYDVIWVGKIQPGYVFLRLHQIHKRKQVRSVRHSLLPDWMQPDLLHLLPCFSCQDRKNTFWLEASGNPSFLKLSVICPRNEESNRQNAFFSGLESGKEERRAVFPE